MLSACATRCASSSSTMNATSAPCCGSISSRRAARCARRRARRPPWKPCARSRPTSPAQIKHALERVLQQRATLERLAQLEGDLAEAAPAPELTTSSAKMRAVLDQLMQAAPHEVPVLLRGESGTGKSVLARAVHG